MQRNSKLLTLRTVCVWVSLCVTFCLLLWHSLYSTPLVQYGSEAEEYLQQSLQDFNTHQQHWKTHRRLNHVTAHPDIYDLQASPPVQFDCVITKTQPAFKICTYDEHTDRYISGSLLATGVWEPYLTALLLTALQNLPEATLIDIGANIGYFSLLAARCGHHVIAAEPVMGNIQRFHRGVHLNALSSSIVLLDNAISDRHMDVTMSRSMDNQGGLQVQHIHPGMILPRGSLVRTTTLDHLLHLNNFTQAILKLDIEGYECRAIRGGLQFLKHVNVPYIFMEWRKMYLNQSTQGTACSTKDIRDLTAILVKLEYIPHEVHTGFQLNPDRSTTRWKIGDVYWRHKLAKSLQEFY